MAEPTMIGAFGHRFGLVARNNSSGSQVWVDRVQRAEPNVSGRLSKYYEIGRVGAVGSTLDPFDFRVVVEQNMASLEFDFLLAGKIPNASGPQQYHLGNMLGQNVQFYLVGRNDASAIDKVIEVTNCRISEIQWQFTVREAITKTFTLDGTQGKWYTSGFPVSTWGPFDDTSPGGIHGKEARIWFTTGSLATTRQFRLQRFNIRATFPVEQPAELGRRDKIGVISDSPDVMIDFDVLTTDVQPVDKLFASMGSGFDLNNPSALFNTYVRVFDPEQAEAVGVLEMYKLENCRFTQGVPTRAQVRGLGTMRYSLTVSKETLADSGGLIVSNRNDL